MAENYLSSAGSEALGAGIDATSRTITGIIEGVAGSNQAEKQRNLARDLAMQKREDLLDAQNTSNLFRTKREEQEASKIRMDQESFDIDKRLKRFIREFQKGLERSSLLQESADKIAGVVSKNPGAVMALNDLVRR